MGHNRIVKECARGKYFDTLTHRYAGMVFDEVFFVDAQIGNDANDGESMDTALRTLNAALDKCESEKQDVIVLRGQEDSTASVGHQTLDKAGLHLLGGGSLFGRGGAGQSVLRAPAAISTVIAGKNSTPLYALLELEESDIEVAGIKLYQGVLATQSQAMVGSGRGEGATIQHLSIHDNIFQMDIYGYNHTTPAIGIALEGSHASYIGYNEFLWGATAIKLQAGGVGYIKYLLCEENRIKGCAYGIFMSESGSIAGIENEFRKNRILPASDGNYCGLTFVNGFTIGVYSDENLFEDELVVEADVAHAFNDSGTNNVWRNCYYIAPGGDGAGTLKSS